MSDNDAAPLEPADAVALTLDELAARAARLTRTGSRRLLGITGAPGAGKSTLCAALAAALGDKMVLVGMDGFHLANEELVRLGRRDRKGAPDTFDVDGYVALLGRLRNQTSDVVYAPTFDRGLEQSVGSPIPVHRDTPLLITEGNYLLLDRDGWSPVRRCLDEVWYLDVPTEVRVDRLVARRRSFGEPADQAAAWVHGVDQTNAAIVETGRGRADLVVQLSTQRGQSRLASTLSTIEPHGSTRSTPHPKEQ